MGRSKAPIKALLTNITQMKTEFKEEQKFTQWWLKLILIGVGVIPIFAIYKQFILGEKFGDKPMSNLALVIFCVFIFGLITMLWFMRLKTEIDPKEIRISFFPLVKKQFNWKEIKKAEIITYDFVGGWGIRLYTKYGTVYNTKGNLGLAIEFLDGEKILIGTQKEAELNCIIKKILLNK